MNTRFNDQGYSLLEGWLEPPLLDELRRCADAAAATPQMPGCDRPHNRLVALRWNDELVDLVLGRDAAVRRLSTAIEADDLRWISGYVSIKEPHSQPLWWHQDWWCWGHPVSYRRDAAQVALLCYLGDTGADSGALRLLPGSHHRSRPLHAVLPEAHAQRGALGSDHAALSDQPDQVTVSARAGDAVVLDYRLLHGTHANAGERRRDCVLLSFTPCWRRLPKDVRAHLIGHLAQPTEAERASASPTWAGLLPSFAGRQTDLGLERAAPARFAAG
jgi:hypothetical protein